MQTYMENRRLKSYNTDFETIVRAFSMPRFGARTLASNPGIFKRLLFYSYCNWHRHKLLRSNSLFLQILFPFHCTDVTIKTGSTSVNKSSVLGIRKAPSTPTPNYLNWGKSVLRSVNRGFNFPFRM